MFFPTNEDPVNILGATVLFLITTLFSGNAGFQISGFLDFQICAGEQVAEPPTEPPDTINLIKRTFSSELANLLGTLSVVLGYCRRIA